MSKENYDADLYFVRSSFEDSLVDNVLLFFKIDKTVVQLFFKNSYDPTSAISKLK